jgi:hypothetical protein
LDPRATDVVMVLGDGEPQGPLSAIVSIDTDARTILFEKRERGRTVRDERGKPVEYTIHFQRCLHVIFQTELDIDRH